MTTMCQAKEKEQRVRTDLTEFTVSCQRKKTILLIQIQITLPQNVQM